MSSLKIFDCRQSTFHWLYLFITGHAPSGIHCRWFDDVQRSAEWSARSAQQPVQALPITVSTFSALGTFQVTQYSVFIYSTLRYVTYLLTYLRYLLKAYLHLHAKFGPAELRGLRHTHTYTERTQVFNYVLDLERVIWAACALSWSAYA